jgi:ATP synthase protein I
MPYVDMSENRNNKLKGLREAYSYSHLGLTFAASILICLFLGKYLDGKWGTEPYLTLVGAFLGGAAGFYYIIKELIQRQKKDENK